MSLASQYNFPSLHGYSGPDHKGTYPKKFLNKIDFKDL